VGEGLRGGGAAKGGGAGDSLGLFRGLGVVLDWGANFSKISLL